MVGDHGWQWRQQRMDVNCIPEENLSELRDAHPGWLQKSWPTEWGGRRKHSRWGEPWKGTWQTGPKQSSHCRLESGPRVFRDADRQGGLCQEERSPADSRKHAAYLEPYDRWCFFVLTYVWVAQVWQRTGNSWHFSLDYRSCFLKQVVEIF